MPACFTLTPVGSALPASFTSIDEAMCAAFNTPVHPTQYYRQWYDIVGFSLALGNSWELIIAKFPDYADIVQWLQVRYEPDAFYSRH